MNTKEKFTPGPWLAEKQIKDTYKHRIYCDDMTGSLVAKTDGAGFEYVYRNPEECDANANLIAAAPELYGILEDCMCKLCDYAEDDESKSLVKEILQLRKKARGEL